MSKKGLHFLALSKPSTILFSALLLIAGVIGAQERIGVAAAVDTTTTDLTLEQERKLVDEGYKIIQNHTIETDEKGKAQMLLIDGTAFTVGPNSSVTLDSFIYNPETAEGSLTVTSKGLMRLVGGKVTKNNPAIIRTNAATVGIRGGIVFVDSEGETTEASFIYGDEMTVTPTLNQDGTYVLTRNGFVVVVDDPLEDVEDVSLLTAEQLLSMQESLQGSPEEEEESEEEPSEEGESEDEAEEESEEEGESEDEESEEEGETEEESSEEESESEDESESEESEDSSEESSEESDSSESDSESEDSSDSEDSSADESTETEEQQTDSASDSDADQDAVETDSETDSEPEIDESALDSSGISDNSSDVEPDELTTATDIDTGTDIDVATDTDTESSEETEVVEDVSEVAQETVQDTSQQEETAEAAEGTPIADALAGETPTSLAADITVAPTLLENTTNVSIATIDVETTGNNQITVEIVGEDSDKVTYNEATQEILLVSGLDFEDDDTLDITVVISDAFGNDQTEDLIVSVTDQNEAPVLSSMEHNNLLSVNASINDIQANGSNISETTEVGSVVASIAVTDQDGDAVQYSLSGVGSENFAISSTGEITLAAALNFESESLFTLEVTSSDGINEMTEQVTIYVINDNEAPSLTLDTEDFSISEGTALNSILWTAVGVDPENSSINYSLSGGGDKFSIDSAGKITLTDSLDYETKTSYELTIFASDGLFSVPKIITVTVTDSNDAPSLSSSVAFNSFLENTSVGTTIATATATDPENNTLTYSLSGTGSDKFTVDSNGNVTLASALDYEMATSYAINLNVSDGANTVTDVLNINVGNVSEFSYSGSLVSSTQAESISTGTVILNSSVSGAEGTVSYSLSDPDNKFAINSSTGEVTLANALDYEVKTSHSFTVSVTDGSSTTSNTFTLSLSDVSFGSLVAALASSSFSESASVGTAVSSVSSIEADGSPTYSITAGNGASKFTVNSSTGAITTAAALDFETAKSYDLTLTASLGGQTTSTTVTVPVQNVEDFESLGIRYNPNHSGSVSTTGAWLQTASPNTNMQEEQGLKVDQAAANNKEGLLANTSGYFVSLVDGDGQYGASITYDRLDFNYKIPICDSSCTYGKLFYTPSQSNFETSNDEAKFVWYDSDMGTPNDINYDEDEVINAGAYFSRDSVGSAKYPFWWMMTDKAAVSTTHWPLTEPEIHDWSSIKLLCIGVAYQYCSNQLTQAGNGLEDISVTSLAPTSYDQLEDVSNLSQYNIIVDTDYYYRSAAEHEADKDDFVDWMKLDSSILYIKIYSENSFATNSDLTTGTQSWVQAIGGDFTVSSSNHTGSGGWRSMGGTLANDQLHRSFNDLKLGVNTPGKAITSATNGIPMFCNSNTITGSGFSEPCITAYFNNDDLDSGVKADLFIVGDVHSVFGYGNSLHTAQDNEEIVVKLINGALDRTQTTYTTYEDQINIATEAYTDSQFNAFTNNGTTKRVVAFAPIPIEVTDDQAGSAYSHYFYPNFVPVVNTTVDTALERQYRRSHHGGRFSKTMDYCEALGLSVSESSECESGNVYKQYTWMEQALEDPDSSGNGADIKGGRFQAFYNEDRWVQDDLNLGSSLWYQVLNPNGKGVGIHAQFLLQDCFNTRAQCDDGYKGMADDGLREHQQTFFSVSIGTLDKRSSDTTRYSAGDTGYAFSGGTYFSHEWNTMDENISDDLNKIMSGYIPMECVSSFNSGCLFASEAQWDSSASNRPIGMMMTNSDPYKKSDMTLGVLMDGYRDTSPFVVAPPMNQMMISQRIASSTSNVISGAPITDSYYGPWNNQGWSLYHDEAVSTYSPAMSSIPHIIAVSARVPSLNTTIWYQTGTSYQWTLKVNSSGYLDLTAWHGSHNKGFTFTASDNQLSVDTDYGFIFEYVGGSCSNNCDASSLFTVKVVNMSTGAVSTPSGSWSYTQHNNLGSSVLSGSGDLYFLSCSDETDCRMYGAVVTTFDTSAQPNDTELAMMVRDPVTWLETYKVGQSYLSTSNQTLSNFTLCHELACGDDTSALESSYATQVWLMGSGDPEKVDWLNNANVRDGLRVHNYVRLFYDQEPDTRTSLTNSAYDRDGMDYSRKNNLVANTSAITKSDYKSLSDFRSTDFYASTASSYSGFFSGILEFYVSGTNTIPMSSLRPGSTLATFTFDSTNDDVQIVAPMKVAAFPTNNFTSGWAQNGYTISNLNDKTITLKFGDADNTASKSAYFSHEVFGAEIQDDGAQIDGSSGGLGNLAGVMVSYNTFEEKQRNLFDDGSDDSSLGSGALTAREMPNTDYSTWGLWAMGANDIIDDNTQSADNQAQVHLGTWVAGELVDQSEIPSSGTASMKGAAVFRVASRYGETGFNDKTQKYVTTANVDASFNWGSGSYTGNIAFSGFDHSNGIVNNAGFASFNIAINGSGNTYSGNSTTSISNGWSGGASLVGALYGGSSVDESGGQVNVNLYKTSNSNGSGENDFYVAEGVYLID